MPSPIRPSIKDRPEPQLASPGASPPREPVPMRSAPRGDDSGAGAPLHFLGEARRGERPAPAFTAGDRLAVSSGSAGDDGARPRRSMVRLTLLLILLVFAGIGAVTVYHAVAGVLPG
jgi:hypothetical protein